MCIKLRERIENAQLKKCQTYCKKILFSFINNVWLCYYNTMGEKFVSSYVKVNLNFLNLTSFGAPTSACRRGKDIYHIYIYTTVYTYCTWNVSM
jgi:hypothetical protein